MGIRRLLSLCCVVVALFMSAALHAQDDSDWYYGKPIKSITFKGLSTVKTSDLSGITESYVGRTFSDDVFYEIVDRLYALDLFDDISPQALPGDSRRNSVGIVFDVTERPVISRITISGNKQVRSTEIKEAVSIKEKDVFVESKVLIAERAVRDLYLSKGFTNVRVSSSTRETDKGVAVSFSITEGNASVISHIYFRGNQVISEKTLRRQLELKEAGVFSKGAFQESALEKDRQSIVIYYHDRGYVDASVVDIIRESAQNEKKQREELTITFVVQEGSQYTFTGIDFSGNTIFSDEQLRSAIKLKDGAVFNRTKFQEGAMAVADMYYESGYTSNQFIPDERKDPDFRTVSYHIDIVENPRSHIEHIILKGNTKTKDQVILRELPLEPGDIFSKTKVQNGLRNLYNLQYFSAVVPDILPGSEENLVDLTLTVEEQSTTTIEFGLTFSPVTDPDDLPFALFVKWQDSNVAGSGKSISASSTLATDEQSVGVAYGESWFFGLPLSFSVGLDVAHSEKDALYNHIDASGYNNTDDYYMDYEQWKTTLSLQLGHRWTPDFAILSWTGGIGTSLKKNIYDEDIYHPLDKTVVDYANKWGIQNYVWTGFSVDDRDINYDPSKGWFASQRLNWYGLTPWEDEFFLKTDTKLEAYVPLVNIPVSEKWAFKLILAGYSGMSMLFPVGNTSIGETSKLYIDGMFNGRGWTDIYNRYNGRSTRGRALWSNILELRFPVAPGILAIDFFGDAAAVKETPYEMFNSLRAEDFFFSWGPGLRFCIPQFPLRLLFANTFRVVDGEYQKEDSWKFVLSFNIVNR